MENLEIADEIKSETNEAKSEVQFCIRVNGPIYRKINDYVTIVRRSSNRSFSKKLWAQEAIKEKLEREKSIFSDKFNAKKITFSIDRSLNDDVDKQVEILKKIHKSYSKKAWFEEAFYEKIENDKHKSQELLEKLTSFAKSKK